MARNTLAKYYGKEVWVVGTYVGAPIAHEEPVAYNYETLLSKNECSRGLIELSDIQPELKNGLIKKDKASCLINVKGINGYEDIAEDHINLQQSLPSSIGYGEVVKVHGFVTKYNGNNYAIIPDSFNRF